MLPPEIKDMNFTQKEDAKRAVYILYFTVFNEQGEQFYVFYGLSGTKLAEFNQMMSSQKPDFQKLQEYGKIIFFGKGEPTEEVKNIMRDEFNFNLEAIKDPNAEATLVVMPVTGKP